MSSERNVRSLLKLCRAAHFVHMAPPCGSFSIARRGGAPRSRAHPMGKPLLPAADLDRVHLGNMLLAVCVRIIRQQQREGRAWSLEQPQTSRMWICPPLLRALAASNARFVVTPFCAWGTAWRKMTKFAFANYPRLVQLSRKCAHTTHQVLQGNGPSGKPWTQIAQPYPRRLCAAFAKVVEQHFLQRYIDRLDSSSKCCAAK